MQQTEHLFDSKHISNNIFVQLDVKSGTKELKRLIKLLIVFLWFLNIELLKPRYTSILVTGLKIKTWKDKNAYTPKVNQMNNHVAT